MNLELELNQFGKEHGLRTRLSPWVHHLKLCNHLKEEEEEEDKEEEEEEEEGEKGEGAERKDDVRPREGGKEEVGKEERGKEERGEEERGKEERGEEESVAESHGDFAGFIQTRLQVGMENGRHPLNLKPRPFAGRGQYDGRVRWAEDSLD
ncbi:unnamed protein product [Pleuronectes platessa]|uniref:Uncharacterized protein n=1 Tax=Pleuronectes platessa TaxID=8262 RepID=A0A9N7TIT4_PLEPL|nr:unnamed protein product [Pleuronectes platessa]